MTTTKPQTLLETVHALAKEIEEERPDITVAVYDASAGPGYAGSGSAAQVYMTARASGECDRCGEALDAEAPGPLSWYTEGEVRGAWSHQHGCGEVNNPEEVGTEIGEDDDPGDALAALLAELDAAVTEERDRVTAQVEARLTARLAAAQADLAAGEDEYDVLTGSETEPGVWRATDGRLAAWDWDPTGRDTEGIVVRESDPQ